MNKKVPLLFDAAKAQATIEKGRRAKWWTRKGRSRSISYFDASGRQLTNEAELDRVRLLVIPPAWKLVRINPAARGKIQAVGMDTAGRVQYIYAPAFAARQQRRKFEKIEQFGALLPRLRRTTNEHIALDELTRKKVLAVAMRLINSLYFRVGTDSSVQNYKTYGITTLQKRHLTIGQKGRLRFDFIGKGHVHQRKVIVDEELAGILKQMLAIGRGRKLFRYANGDGKYAAIKPAQINTYLKEAVGPEYSAKDFRTWGATVAAAAEFASVGKSEHPAEIKKNIGTVVRRVAAELGNTPAVCRGSYIHPAVIQAYENGVTIDEFRPRGSRTIKRKADELYPEERALIRLLAQMRNG